MATRTLMQPTKGKLKKKDTSHRNEEVKGIEEEKKKGGEQKKTI